MITCSILWISECHGTNLTVKLRWATAGVPHVTVVGCAGGLAIKMHQRLGTQPTAAFSAAGIRVYRSVQECTGVYRSDSLDTLMQEERPHFRVDAIGGKSGALFCLFEFASVWGVV